MEQQKQGGALYINGYEDGEFGPYFYGRTTMPNGQEFTIYLNAEPLTNVIEALSSGQKPEFNKVGTVKPSVKKADSSQAKPYKGFSKPTWKKSFAKPPASKFAKRPAAPQESEDRDARDDF